MKIFAIIHIILGGLIFPFVYVGILFGLAGSNPQPYIMIAIGYLAIMMGCFVSLFVKSKSKKQWLLYIILASYALITIGLMWDNNFWEDHNADLCKQIINDSKCFETETGFNCSQESSLGGLTVSKVICEGVDR